MSARFLEQLDLPDPHYNLAIGSGSHASQIADAMIRFDEVLVKEQPDVVIVVGDVNSTLSCALAATTRGVPLAHVEAGLRSGDRTMPEETNRILTDSVSELLFTHCEDANLNLFKEGVEESRVFFVGNIMVDSLLRLEGEAAKLDMPSKLGLEAHSYLLVTLHRPMVVDDKEKLEETMNALLDISELLPVVFPAHPRTKSMLDDLNLTRKTTGRPFWLIEPLGYTEFLSLQLNARAVLTDSGGIQEETTIIGTPCFTYRDNTERPVTITEGTNRLIGTKPDSIRDIPGLLAEDPLSDKRAQGKAPMYWDGNTACRITAVIINHFGLTDTDGIMVPKLEE